MRKKKLISLLILLLFSVIVFAQPRGRIIGRVLSKEKVPMEAVAVSIKGTDRGTHTNENGEFRFYAHAGKHFLLISYLGRAPQEQEIMINPRGTTNIGDIILEDSESELGEVVVSGDIRHSKNSEYVARMPISYIENPQVYTTIPKELMEIQVATSMEDVLKNATGASNIARGYGSGGVGVQIMQRGFSSGINMRNGMSTNSLALTDPINIERIEVIKGPSGALFGTTISYGGLVNKVTKKPHERQAMSFSYTAGSWSNNRFTADVNLPLNKEKTIMGRVNALYAGSNSYMKGSPVNKSWAIDPSFTYKVNDRLTLNLDLEIYHNEGLTNYVQISNNVEKAISGKNEISMNQLKYNWKNSYADRELISTTETFNAYFEAIYKISDQWQSQTSYSHSGVELGSNYFFINYQTPETFTRSINRIPGTFDRDQFQQNFIGDFKIGNLRNRTLIGFDYLYTTNENKRNSITYDKNPIQYNAALADTKISMPIVESLLATNASVGKETGPFGSKKSIYSAYVSDVLNITPNLNIMAALRVDHYISDSYEQTSYSPKVGLVYEIIKDKLSVFGNYLDGFKNVSPSASDIDGTIKDWNPEHAIQLEGGVKAQMFDGRLVASFGIYNIKVKDVMRSITEEINKPDPSNPGSEITETYKYNIQDGERSSKGFDIDITAYPINGWTLVAGYGYNDSEYKKVSNKDLIGNRPSNLPLHSVNFWTDYKLTVSQFKGLGVGVGGNYIGKSYYSDYNWLYNPGRFTMDGTIYYSQSKYRISLKMNNLMNKHCWTLGRGAQPVKPREILGSITIHL